MKKILITFLSLTIVASVFAQKNKGSEVSNVVRLNPLGLLFGNASVSYERVLNEKSSAQANLSFGSLSVGSIKYSSFGFGVDYKRYLSSSKEAPRGFYVSPGVGFSSTSVSNGSDKVSGTGFIIKGVIGNQWVWDSGFSLDLFGGINYYASGALKGNNGEEYAKFSGVLPSLGIGLGYAF